MYKAFPANPTSRATLKSRLLMLFATYHIDRRLDLARKIKVQYRVVIDHPIHDRRLRILYNDTNPPIQILNHLLYIWNADIDYECRSRKFRPTPHD